MIMTALAIAACNRDYVLRKLDVKGVFIQTEMKGKPVYIRCSGAAQRFNTGYVPRVH
jgi:hypothetical protein